ncbi:MAG: hypothetical protein M3292_13340 [Actinomycetota bacterium]|nr:hypothetical protein [Actinomycetota bacterium]
MIGFALLFWLVVAFALAFVVFNVGSPRGGEEIPDILLLIAPVVGGAMAGIGVAASEPRLRGALDGNQRVPSGSPPSSKSPYSSSASSDLAG